MLLLGFLRRYPDFFAQVVGTFGYNCRTGKCDLLSLPSDPVDPTRLYYGVAFSLASSVIAASYILIWNEFHKDRCNYNVAKFHDPVVEKKFTTLLFFLQRGQGISQRCNYNGIYEMRSRRHVRRSGDYLRRVAEGCEGERRRRSGDSAASIASSSSSSAGYVDSIHQREAQVRGETVPKKAFPACSARVRVGMTASEIGQT